LKTIKDVFKLTWIPILVASLCCIAPIVLVLLGISTLTFAISLTDLLDVQYRWLFILVAIIVFVIGLVIYFRKRGICTLDQLKRRRNEVINKVIITLVFGILTYYIFFYVILGIIGKSLRLWN